MRTWHECPAAGANALCLSPCTRLLLAGFDFAFMSGFCTAGARLGAPDAGLISYAEMVDTVSSG